jgi:hypothetical protein
MLVVTTNTAVAIGSLELYIFYCCTKRGVQNIYTDAFELESAVAVESICNIE